MPNDLDERLRMIDHQHRVNMFIINTTKLVMPIVVFLLFAIAVLLFILCVGVNEIIHKL